MGLFKKMVTESFDHNRCETTWTSALIWGRSHTPEEVHIGDMSSNSAWVAASSACNLGWGKLIAQDHIMYEL